MTRVTDEQVSALMDGESDARSLGNLARDDAMKAIWQRYHMISDIMHQRPVLSLQSDLTVIISDLIKNEPTVLAPSPKSIPAYLRPVAGVAVAASVAIMVVLGIQQYQENAVNPQQPQRVAVQADASVRDAIATRQQQPLVNRAATIQPVQMEVQPGTQPSTKLSRYMMNHSEYQSNSGVHGVPHVRLVVTGVDE